MNIFDIPFNRFLGLEISPNPDYLLMLPAKGDYENHLQTVHASALFALAEASSGLYLLREFADVENVVPVVRNVDMKYKKPGQGPIFSKASLSMSRETILTSLNSKRRALIPVQISLFDQNSVLLVQGTFEWFILINEN